MTPFLEGRCLVTCGDDSHARGGSLLLEVQTCRNGLSLLVFLARISGPAPVPDVGVCTAQLVAVAFEAQAQPPNAPGAPPEDVGHP